MSDGLDVSTLSLRDVGIGSGGPEPDLEAILNVPVRNPASQLAPLKKAPPPDKLPVASLFDTGKPGSGNKNFKVAVRVRPLIERERVSDRGTRLTVSFDSNTSLTIRQPSSGWDEDDDEAPTSFTTSAAAATTANQHSFSFDKIYDPSVGQEELYTSGVAPVVDSILEGYNGSIICYGQTGTGKTHTVEGGKGDQKGIIPRASDQIFSHIENKADAHSRYLVRVSFLQIYNEKLIDLLHSTKRKGAASIGPAIDKALKIRRTAAGGIFVQGLSEHVVRTPSDVANLLVQGGAMRTTAQTNMNVASSRSHAVFSIIVERAHMDASKKGSNSVTIGKLNLVDLAGSERLKTTGVTGVRLEETKNINSSLSAFGKVILALTTQSRKHVPYRDSQLTQLLQDSLGGNCKTTLITTITPASSSYSESVNTLNFANRAKKVKNYAMVNQDMTDQALLSKYEKEIKRLQRALQEQREGGQLVDRSELERVESKWAEVFREKEAVMSELEKREQEVEKYANEKKSLEERISALEGMLVVGGTHAADASRAEDTEEFQVAVRKKQEELHKEYIQKVQSVEQERQELARARELLAKKQEEIDREREQMASRTSATVGEVAGDYRDDMSEGVVFDRTDGGRQQQWATRRQSSGVLHNTWVSNKPEPISPTRFELDDYIRALRHPETGIRLCIHATHGPCFSGADAAMWFTHHMQGVDTIEAAEEIGNRFIKLRVIASTEQSLGFQAADHCFYTFTPETDDATMPPHSPEPRPSSELSHYSASSDAALTSRPQTSASGAFSTDGFSYPVAASPQRESPDGMLEEDAGSNALHAAAAKGDRSAVKQLIPAYGIECTDHSGRTPLMYAVIGNKQKICELLIRCGANLFADDNNGRTPLLCAAYYGNADCMRVLLGQKASTQVLLRSTDIAGRSALHWSTKAATTAGLQLLAKHCSSQVINAYDDDKTTALHWAVLFRRPQHLQILLKTMLADASLPDADGRTCLHYAVSTNQLDCAKFITEQWPGILNQKDKRGRTALHVAVSSEGTPDMLQHILSCSECDVNATDARKTTPLHWAAVSNRPDVAMALLNHGAKVMMRDSFSMTPLHYSIQKGHGDVTKLLQHYGSNKQKAASDPITSVAASGSTQPGSPGGGGRAMSKSRSVLLTASADHLLSSQSVLAVPESSRQAQSTSPTTRPNGILVNRRRSSGAHLLSSQMSQWRERRASPDVRGVQDPM